MACPALPSNMSSDKEARVKVQCPGCQAAFNVPDDKIPEGKGLRIPCPKCRTPIEVEAGKPSGEEEDFKVAESPLSSSSFPDISSGAAMLDVVEEGVKTALICISDPVKAEKVLGILRELQFYAVRADKAHFAMAKLHYNNYDLVVLDELFDAPSAAENIVIHHIQLLPMHDRRQFFLCLLSDRMPTADILLAYRIGVNFILNVRDIDKIKLLLVRALKEHEGFYSLFMDGLTRKSQGSRH